MRLYFQSVNAYNDGVAASLTAHVASLKQVIDWQVDSAVPQLAALKAGLADVVTEQQKQGNELLELQKTNSDLRDKLAAQDAAHDALRLEQDEMKVFLTTNFSGDLDMDSSEQPGAFSASSPSWASVAAASSSGDRRPSRRVESFIPVISAEAERHRLDRNAADDCENDALRVSCVIVGAPTFVDQATDEKLVASVLSALNFATPPTRVDRPATYRPNTVAMYFASEVGPDVVSRFRAAANNNLLPAALKTLELKRHRTPYLRQLMSKVWDAAKHLRAYDAGLCAQKIDNWMLELNGKRFSPYELAAPALNVSQSKSVILAPVFMGRPPVVLDRAIDHCPFPLN
jgi:hypothetical protein